MAASGIAAVTRPGRFVGPVLGLVLILAAFPVLAQEQPAPAQPPSPPILTTPMPAPGMPDPARLAAQEGAAARPADPAAPALAAPDPAALPDEADLWAIVWRAHPVVQATMALLAAMVFAVVTIFLFKTTEIARSNRRLGRGFRHLAEARSLADITPAAQAMARRAATEPSVAMLRAVGDELGDLPTAIGRIEAEGLNDRLTIAFDRIEATAIARLRAGTGALPQIASTAPFIGLFGTVFGIMNAFLAIAESGTSSLAVVAPGIAEALLATAIGLVAAIPAVIVHNMLQRRIASYRQRIDDVAALAARLVSHDLTARRLAGRRQGLD